MLGDSTHVTGKVYTETYYAYRLLIRAVKANKDRMQFTKTSNLLAHKALVARDPSALWVLVMNANGPVKVDLSAVPGYGGSATLYEYSSARKDQIAGTLPVTGGIFTFSAPDSSLVLAKVPALPLCNGRAVTLVGTTGNDALTGTAGVDVIHGLAGDDAIEGLGGNDVICGGDGNDTVYGGDGGDKVYGGNGNDLIYGGAGSDVIQGEPGDDTVVGEGGNDVLVGGSGTDTCDGGAGTGDASDATCETATGIP
jgi:Ca2+-binding RTX toxin-like protein